MIQRYLIKTAKRLMMRLLSRKRTTTTNKNDMFQNQASHSTRLNETKKVLFSKSNLEKTSESDKSPYIQNKQEKKYSRTF